MTAVVALEVAGPVEPWQRLGLQVEEHRFQVGGVQVRLLPTPPGAPTGVVRWVLADCPTPVESIDGLPTGCEVLPPRQPQPAVAPSAVHDLGALSFDHLVVMTSSLERTCGAIEAATGAPLKRIREAGPIRQGFHRLGELVVEVVESMQVTAPVASFWGFVLVVEQLDDVCQRLGPELVSPPKPAVQPGRRIATVRSGAGLGVPLALMTP